MEKQEQEKPVHSDNPYLEAWIVNLQERLGFVPSIPKRRHHKPGLTRKK